MITLTFGGSATDNEFRSWVEEFNPRARWIPGDTDERLLALVLALGESARKVDFGARFLVNDAIVVHFNSQLISADNTSPERVGMFTRLALGLGLDVGLRCYKHQEEPPAHHVLTYPWPSDWATNPNFFGCT